MKDTGAMMLHEFLTANHNDLIKRCNGKAKLRFQPSLDPETIDHGVPMFLQQLEDILRFEQTTDVRRELESEPEATPSGTDIGRAAALHGSELLRLGFTVDQVVHGYGDVCQAVTGLAVERHMNITADEFRTLNRCLDNAIADAVSAYARNGGDTDASQKGRSLSKHLDDYTGEHRRLVDIAANAYSAMKTGNIGMAGATGALLAHALEQLRLLPQRILPEVRVAIKERKQRLPFSPAGQVPGRPSRPTGRGSSPGRKGAPARRGRGGG
jgi:hypothetical protein